MDLVEYSATCLGESPLMVPARTEASAVDSAESMEGLQYKDSNRSMTPSGSLQFEVDIKTFQSLYDDKQVVLK